MINMEMRGLIGSIVTVRNIDGNGFGDVGFYF
jgi:hypothetical protein